MPHTGKPESTTVTITEEQRQAIVQAIGRMPYGAMVTMRPVAVNANDVIDDVVDYLNGLAAVLRIVGDHNRAVEDDRNRLLRQQAAIREFLGLAEERR